MWKRGLVGFTAMAVLSCCSAAAGSAFSSWSMASSIRARGFLGSTVTALSRTVDVERQQIGADGVLQRPRGPARSSWLLRLLEVVAHRARIEAEQLDLAGLLLRRVARRAPQLRFDVLRQADRQRLLRVRLDVGVASGRIEGAHEVVGHAGAGGVPIADARGERMAEARQGTETGEEAEEGRRDAGAEFEALALAHEFAARELVPDHERPGRRGVHDGHAGLQPPGSREEGREVDARLPVHAGFERAAVEDAPLASGDGGIGDHDLLALVAGDVQHADGVVPIPAAEADRMARAGSDPLGRS